jgi:hypothetical protein
MTASHWPYVTYIDGKYCSRTDTTRVTYSHALLTNSVATHTAVIVNVWSRVDVDAIGDIMHALVNTALLRLAHGQR